MIGTIPSPIRMFQQAGTVNNIAPPIVNNLPNKSFVLKAFREIRNINTTSSRQREIPNTQPRE